ncbi:hypothetical protein [Rhodanobacter sp. B05]|jgi:uncharacterized protein (TIGR02284 family)|uniref:hypothetical protein n=1 Tax=Rhodanobacter sp. B05 TaxID=1945859 RepID=UPI0020C3DAB6|nr:hypothetical protein [Rhodanobacter sp. B05]
MKLSATRTQVALPAHAAQAVCRDLIQRSIDLRQMYRQAAQVCEPGLRTVLLENAQTLDLLIDDLLAQACASGGQACDPGSWRGTARRQLSTWLIRVLARQDRAWLQTLAHRGADLLQAFEDAIGQLPAEWARVLCRQLPRLHAIHQDMHCLVGSAS